MNLISCGKCGVVLDKNKIRFPEELEDSDGAYDITKAQWNGRKYAAFSICPVCKDGEILEEEEY